MEPEGDVSLGATASRIDIGGDGLSSGFSAAAGRAAAESLGEKLLLNIPHELSVEVGKTQLKGTEITDLTYGSVIELDKIAGDPVDLVLNGSVIAQGEVVLINNEKIGIRIIGINQD
ncbi:MAG: FliM/FliN family flagellar motor switch protein [SAR324 cluster bacterium]|nr:FliM/FliN family flagellar motor switch protein [SAR324 cluster bacterium]